MTRRNITESTKRNKIRTLNLGANHEKEKKRTIFICFKDEKASEGGKCIIALHIRKIKGISVKIWKKKERIIRRK